MLQALTRDQVVHQVHALGVSRASVLIVHTALSKVGPVEGGPQG